MNPVVMRQIKTFSMAYLLSLYYEIRLYQTSGYFTLKNQGVFPLFFMGAKTNGMVLLCIYSGCTC